MTTKQSGDALNDSWSIDGLRFELRKGAVDDESQRTSLKAHISVRNSHIFHDVQKTIVYVRMLRKLDLDLIQIGQGIFDVERRLFGRKKASRGKDAIVSQGFSSA